MFGNVVQKLALLVACMFLLSTAYAQGGAGSFISPGPLTFSHQDLDNNCFACHSLTHGVDEQRCMACHEGVRRQVTKGLGFHAGKGSNCEGCHAEHRGRDFALVQLETDKFDHSTTGFSLFGAHADAACTDCHTEPGKYIGLQSTCVSCHEDPHGHEVSSRDLLESCDRCHNESDWRALPIPKTVFDHSSGAQTEYALEGAHNDVYCGDCHFDWKFVPVEHDACRDCHEDPHRANFGRSTCEDCHGRPTSWRVSDFDHDRTPYPLVGQHAQVECDACHNGHATAPLAYGTCEDCHEDLHGGQFKPRPCEECHTVDVAAFALRTYNHDQTSFPLVGLHQNTTCEECHGDREEALYVGRPFDDCDACHVDEHDGRFEPTLCQKCHTPEGFRALFFNHDDTAFPHTGKHKEVACNGCHEDFKWIGFAFGSCADCHDEASPHEEGVLGPETCDTCHDTEAFNLITFDHAANTRFDLAPAHLDNKCSSCHDSVDRFAGLNSECQACHRDDKPWGHYEGRCGDCHLAEDWFPGGLGDKDHAVTGFPLEGQHAQIDCEDCHAPTRARGEANPLCVSCHSDDDSHRRQLGSECQDCHATTTWFRVRWRHATTGWPLRGAHKLAGCNDCHAATYVGTPTDCYRCHSKDASPGEYHQTELFQFCESCHREYAWSPPIFRGGL